MPPFPFLSCSPSHARPSAGCIIQKRPQPRGWKKNHARPAAGLYGPGTGLLRKAPAFNFYTTISGRGLYCALVKIWRQANGEYGLSGGQPYSPYRRETGVDRQIPRLHTHTPPYQGPAARGTAQKISGVSAIPRFAHDPRAAYLIDS
jgi:hypothetical protein